MRRCETCGNEYARTMTVVLDGEQHVFDSFECAIHALAPACAHCGCRVIGHGIDRDGGLYCCTHCATAARATATGGYGYGAAAASRVAGLPPEVLRK